LDDRRADHSRHPSRRPDRDPRRQSAAYRSDCASVGGDQRLLAQNDSSHALRVGRDRASLLRLRTARVDARVPPDYGLWSLLPFGQRD
jgi:hypothetical protein